MRFEPCARPREFRIAALLMPWMPHRAVSYAKASRPTLRDTRPKRASKRSIMAL